MNYLFKAFAHFSVRCFVSFLLQEFFIYCGYESFLTYRNFKYLFSLCGLPFHSLSVVFWWAEVLIFMSSSLSVLFFMIGIFLCSVLFVLKKFFTDSKVMKLFSCVRSFLFCLCHLIPWFTWNWCLKMVWGRGQDEFFFHMDTQLIHFPLLKRSSFPHFTAVTSLSSIEWIDLIFS